MRTTKAADTKIAGIDVAGLIDKETRRAKVGSPATLIKRSPRQPETGNTAGKTRVRETRIPCRGIRDEVAKGGARIVIVTLFGASIKLGTDRVVPVQGDAVEIRGETLEVIEVADDPAAATYTCTTKAVGTGPR